MQDTNTVIDLENLKQYNDKRLKHIESVDLKNMTATFSDNRVVFLPDLIQGMQSMYNSIYISNISALAGYCKLSSTKTISEKKFTSIVNILVRKIKQDFPDVHIQVEPTEMIAETFFKNNYYANDVRLSFTMTYFPKVNTVQVTSYSGTTGLMSYTTVNEVILRAIIKKTLDERFVEK